MKSNLSQLAPDSSSSPVPLERPPSHLYENGRVGGGGLVKTNSSLVNSPSFSSISSISTCSSISSAHGSISSSGSSGSTSSSFGNFSTLDRIGQFHFAKSLLEASVSPLSASVSPSGENFQEYGEFLLNKYKQQQQKDSHLPVINNPALALQKEGFRWMRKLVKKGMNRGPLVEACLFMGEVYENGLYGQEVCKFRAFFYTVLAAKQNDPVGTYKAGYCYEYGIGTKKDYSKALKFYRKASALGEYRAMYKLGKILLNGTLGVERNFREGITWLKRSVSVSEQEYVDAMYDLAKCYESEYGYKSQLISDEEYSFRLYEKAANKGHSPSQYRLGLVYEYGQLGQEKDAAKSIEYYKLAIENGIKSKENTLPVVSDAELAMSGWYLVGAPGGILNQSEHQAYDWALRAAEKGLVKAQFALGYFAENGIGCQTSKLEARKWYNLAAKGGNTKAAHRLKEMKKEEKEIYRKNSPSGCTIS